jgi:hypothetical protein
MTWILPQRRNCADLCPNGMSSCASFGDRSLITLLDRHEHDSRGHAVRHVVVCQFDVKAYVWLLSVVLDATVHLHEHIATIRERIRELQGALAEVQRGHSTEPHPLLAATAESSSDEEEEGLESVSALTRTIDDLALADDGSVVFFGTAPTPLAAPAPIATPSSTIAAQTIVSCAYLLHQTSL